MGEVLVILALAYLAVAAVVMRKHYASRHGLPYTRHTPIFNTSTFIGVVWPVSLCIESWRNPVLCQHRAHLAARH